MKRKMMNEDTIKEFAVTFLGAVFEVYVSESRIDIDDEVKIVNHELIRYFNIYANNVLYFTVDWFGNLKIRKESLNLNLFKLMKYIEKFRNNSYHWLIIEDECYVSNDFD